MRFLSRILTIFFINSIYSLPEIPDIKSFYELCETLEKAEKNNEELTQKIEELNKDINHLNSKLYISENRLKDREIDHQRVIKEKNAEIEKLNKKSWISKATPFLVCALSLALIFIIVRIYLTLYPIQSNDVLD